VQKGAGLCGMWPLEKRIPDCI